MKKEDKEIVFITPRAKIVLWVVCLIVGIMLQITYLSVFKDWLWRTWVESFEGIPKGTIVNVIPWNNDWIVIPVFFTFGMVFWVIEIVLGERKSRRENG